MRQTKTVEVVSTEDPKDESFVGVIEQSESLVIPVVNTINSVDTRH